jgi:DMSO/TMAO reductase YedYZ molybdopterin-dependent catalytic subunit
MINPAPYNAEAPPEALAGEITPTEFHYVRSNFALPSHDGTLEIGGAVDNPLSLTLEDLRAMPRHERAVTLECAGNGRLAMRPLPIGEPWGDYAVSTARWSGALLHEVLQQARPAANGVDVRFQGADHGAYHLTPVLADTDKDDLTFVRALPLAHAADPAAEILIAYEMNGKPLGPDHGAPFRIIVPHWYAVASVKWLKRIDVLTESFGGEFQTGHYMYEWPDRPPEPVDVMRVRARITAPAAGSVLSPGICTVRGKAWSGTGPVTRVEISLTGEGDWHAAQLAPPSGPYHWQDWAFDWDAGDIGRHTLRARATDAAGNVQPEVPPWNRLGYGNNAIEVIYVDVA